MRFKALLILLILLALLWPLYANAGTVVTFGRYELYGTADAGTDATTLIDVKLGTGVSGYASWKGFYVGSTSGVSALITDWSPGTWTATLAAPGIAGFTSGSTYILHCRYTDVRDTSFIQSVANKHYGTDVELYFDWESGNTQSPGLYFNTSVITASSTVNSCDLYANLTAEYYGGAMEVQAGKAVYSQGTIWEEIATVFNFGATWAYYDHDTTTDWDAASNDFSDAYSDVVSPAVDINAVGSGGWTVFNIQTLAEDWITDSDANLGLYIAGINTEPTDNYARWASKENAIRWKHWYVVLDYTEPGAPSTGEAIYPGPRAIWWD